MSPIHRPLDLIPGRSTVVHSPALLRDYDVAVLLSVSRRTVWSLTGSGTLASVRLGRRSRRWRLVDVLEFIDALSRTE